MGRYDVRSQMRMANGALGNWVTDDRGINIHQLVNLPTVKQVTVEYDDDTSQSFKRVPDRDWAYHRFSNRSGQDITVGDKADCGWHVTQEWLEREQVAPTMENVCPRCRDGVLDLWLVNG